MTPARTLVLPVRPSSTGELLAGAAARRGMAVARIAPHAVPPELAGAACLYGGPVFAGRVAGRLGITLLEPPDGWLTALPYELTRRTVEAMTLGEARGLRHPAFVKEPREKALPAAVYADGSRLPAGPADLPVLVSEIVTFTVEYRLFVLDGRVRAGSRYAVFGRLDPLPLAVSPHRDEVLAFAGDLLAAYGHTVPRAVVIDVGLAARADRPDEPVAGRWAVVEANMAWFSSCYAAEADDVLEVVLHAAGPAGAQV